MTNFNAWWYKFGCPAYRMTFWIFWPLDKKFHINLNSISGTGRYHHPYHTKECHDELPSIGDHITFRNFRDMQCYKFCLWKYEVGQGSAISSDDLSGAFLIWRSHFGKQVFSSKCSGLEMIWMTSLSLVYFSLQYIFLY